MPTIHFLNVKDGDCSILEHYSGHKTVIDVCNAKPVELMQEALMAKMAEGRARYQRKLPAEEIPGEPH